MNYRLTSEADRGLNETLAYVEERFDFETAIRALEKIEKALLLLCESPYIGHRRAGITSSQDVLFWPVGPALIAYRVLADGIQVLFIERGARDWQKPLRT